MSSFVTAASALAVQNAKAASSDNTQKMIVGGMISPTLIAGGVAYTPVSRAEADRLEAISKAEKYAKELCEKKAMSNMLEYTLVGSGIGAGVCGRGGAKAAATCAALGGAIGGYRSTLQSEIDCLDIRNKVIKKE